MREHAFELGPEPADEVADHGGNHLADPHLSSDRWNFVDRDGRPGASDAAKQALADQLIDNVANFVEGRPTNIGSGAF